MTGARRGQHWRWGVPALAAVGVAAVAVVPRTDAEAEPPPLPVVTASQLLTDVEQAHVDGLSGTVTSSTDLGLPDLPGGDRGGGGGSGGPATSALALSLFTGAHTYRLSAAGDRARVALLGNLSERDVVSDGHTVWLYDSETSTATHWALPAQEGGPEHQPPATPLTPQEAADQALAAISPTTVVRVDRAALVAGRPAYQLVLEPKQTGSLVSSVRIAVDAASHVPLRVQVWAVGQAQPAAEVGFSDVSFAEPGSGVFAFAPPPDATVLDGDHPARTRERTQPTEPSGPVTTETVGDGWTAVAVVHGAALDPRTSEQLDQMSRPAPGGRLVTTALVSVLVAPDGTLYAGAVTPDLLEQVASRPAR